MIEKITIKVGDISLELTKDQARELKTDLDEIFKTTEYIPYYPQPYYQRPYYPSVPGIWWSDINGFGTTTTDSSDKITWSYT